MNICHTCNVIVRSARYEERVQLNTKTDYDRSMNQGNQVIITSGYVSHAHIPCKSMSYSVLLLNSYHK